ncbi:MAG: tetratricopeptide repeat protein [Elusimicrobia bacterium]|nr:tetratricopeptide repeat protein [Elusimicrobiota bacterium]
MSERRARLGTWLLGLLVILSALAAFLPALDNGFVRWDDDVYLLDNPWFRGLGWANVRWMLTTTRGALWQPLTWLSFAFDYSAWGLEPCGYHLTNILLHAATAALFYAVCLHLFEGVRPRRGSGENASAAALAALFFAVHPLRVESVAWATERKDVLSGVFWMAALLAHLKAVAGPTSRRLVWRAGSLAAFALSLTAKVSGMALPAVLLILDVYPLRRLPADPRRWSERPQRRVLASVAPYFGLAAAAFLWTFAAAELSGNLHGFDSQGAAWRVGQAFYGLLFYPVKTLWPSGLSPYYPPLEWFRRWSWQLFACGAAVSAALAVILRLSRSRPAIGAAFACYAVMIAPMVGLVQHGLIFRACDRFSYLPCLGFAALFGGALAGARPAARGAAAACLAALGLASWGQCRVWRDTLTLWSTAAGRAPGGFALSNTGVALIAAGRSPEGVPLLERAVAQYPRLALAYDNLGVALHRLGEKGRARALWRQGLAAEATADLHAHLGVSLAAGRDDELPEGLAHLRTAVTLMPQQAAWRVDLADALARAGRLVEAEAQYGAALALDPQAARAQNNWGLLLARKGIMGAAVVHYRLALRSPDDRAEANYNWGNALLAEGAAAEAERHYREALRTDPGLAQAQVNLGNILVRRGRLTEAVTRYRLALQSAPRLPEARANLAAVQRALGR